MLLSTHSEEDICAVHEVTIDERVWISDAVEGGGGAHVWWLEEDHKKCLEWE